MRFALLVAAFALRSLSFAAPETGRVVSLEMILKKNNKVVSQPTVLVRNGHTATVTEAYNSGKPQISIELKPELMAAPEKKHDQMLKISFKLSQMRGSLVQELAQPQVVVANGRTAVVTQKSKEGEDLELIVTPRVKK